MLRELQKENYFWSKTYAQQGSIIITDCFRSYTNLSQHYTHFTVNPSKNFVNPQTCACTNTLEGTWNFLKYKISPRNRTNTLAEKEYMQQNL
ncbi:hypothetical protein HZS_3766 [Henneguya salminicola]|nr:hypothetical protein HZS_3766 [Henneguya salminicola]